MDATSQSLHRFIRTHKDAFKEAATAIWHHGWPIPRSETSRLHAVITCTWTSQRLKDRFRCTWLCIIPHPQSISMWMTRLHQTICHHTNTYPNSIPNIGKINLFFARKHIRNHSCLAKNMSSLTAFLQKHVKFHSFLQETMSNTLLL